ncbi:RNA polymerase II accessory factor [Heracleum sosnowskyi]|uniref:RNA polymerase II accessory factor n=1 Tax=Heracleum sosnowskyi TaxID=360622 RepID=A0AAD8IT08_9APIA|nr:RNA polymerase II accessory factor [Heracleum sosnowskyi]
MDPLSVLRDFTTRDELSQIVRVGDHYRFGNSYTFPCSIETAYRSKQGNLYTLETLVYFVNNLNSKHHDYIRIAGTHKIPAVTFLDRKPLIDYLHSRIESTDAIEFVAPQNVNKYSGFDEYKPEEANLGVMESDIDLNLEGSSLGVEDGVVLVREIERPFKDRESLLQCRNRDFYSVLVAATKRNEERERSEMQQRKDGLVAKSRIERRYGEDVGFEATPKAKMHLKGSKIGEGVPIILVPSASQTLITIYNVKEFLEDGVYIPTDVKVKQMKGPKPDCVTVQKKFSRDRVVTAYEVRDKPSALKAEDWDRVVAVFVLGKEWQFKDWPFKDHVEIFNNILGFYMHHFDQQKQAAPGQSCSTRCMGQARRIRAVKIPFLRNNVKPGSVQF